MNNKHDDTLGAVANVLNSTPGTAEHNAAIEAAKAVVETLDRETADTAAAGATGEAEQVEGTQVPLTEAATSEAPAGADDGHVDDAALAGNGGPVFSIEGAGTETVEASQPEPVQVTKVPPTKAKGESNKAFKKRLAAWVEANPDYVPPKVEAKATETAKAETKGGDSQGGEKGEGGKTQGGRPTTENPHTDPLPSTKAPAKVEGKATAPVVQPKAKALTPRQAALADQSNVCGYDLSKWPKPLAHIMPTREAILAVRATCVLATWLTKNELAWATYAHPAALGVNVYDVATALQAVLGGSHDHKLNVINQKARPAMMATLRQGRVPCLNDGGRALVSYFAPFTGKAMKLIKAAFAQQKVEVPLWLSDPDLFTAEQVKAQVQAENV